MKLAANFDKNYQQYTLTNIDIEEEGYCDFYFGKDFAPGGYIWVFPKGKDVANVGIGVLASLSAPGMAHRLLDKFIDLHPELKKGEAIRFLAGAVPVAEPIETVRDNLLLVGDAARHVDPITGGGLMLSIQGGKIAGETIGKAVETQRFDMEMLKEFGYCHGIENYSRHLSGRAPGEPAFCLIDYFPDDFLMIIDESHVTVPQIGGMYEGDRSRKQNLIDFG